MSPLICILTQQEIFETLPFWWEFVLSQAKHHSLNEAESVFMALGSSKCKAYDSPNKMQSACGRFWSLSITILPSTMMAVDAWWRWSWFGVSCTSSGTTVSTLTAAFAQVSSVSQSCDETKQKHYITTGKCCQLSIRIVSISSVLPTLPSSLVH